MAEGAGVEVGKISIKVTPDTHQFRRDLRRELEEIERTLRGTIQVNADLDGSGARAHMAALMAELHAMARDRVKVDVDVDRNLLGDLSASAGSASRSFMGLTRVGWIVTAVFAAAAPVIGLVAGLLAGLPSLVSAFGAGAGAIALGLDGITQAAQVMQPAFNDLKASVSGVFQQQLTPIFQQLNAIFPTLKAGMGQVATGLSSMAGQFVNVVTSAQGMDQIKNILANTGKFFTDLGPAVNTGMQAFLKLSEAGSAAFGYLSTSLNTFSQGFLDMTNRVVANGTFDGAMQGLSQTLDGILGLFNRLMESGLQAMAQLGAPLNNMFSGLGDTIIALMEPLTALSAGLGNVLGEAGRQLAPVITALTPAFTELTNLISGTLVGAMQALGPVLTQVASALGGALLSGIQALAPIMPGLVQTFGTLATALGGAFVTAINALAPVMPVLATAFGQLATALGQGLTEAVTALAPFIPQIAEGFTQLVTAVAPLIPTLISSLTPAIKTVMDAIVGALPSILQLVDNFIKLLPVIVPVVQTIISLAGAVANFGATIAGAVLGAISALIGKFGEVMAKVSEWIASFASGAQEIAAKAAELPGKVGDSLKNMITIGLEAGKNLVQGFINGIGGMISAAVSKAQELASSVAGAVKGFLGIHSPSKLFETYGQYTAQGFGIGMENGFQPVIEQAKALASQVGDAFAKGTDPTVLLDGYTKKDIDRIEKTLGFNSKDLARQIRALNAQAKLTGDKTFKARAEELSQQKEQIDAYKEMIDLTQEYSDTASSAGKNGEDPLVKAASGLMASPVNFAKATGKQFLSDIGISGDGAISKAITEGISYVFQIGSVDEALSIKDREDSKRARSMTGR